MITLPSEVERLCDQIVGLLTHRVREMMTSEFKRWFGASFLGGKLTWSAVQPPTIITVTADATLSAADTNTDDWIIADATSGAITLTFPPVSDRARPYYIIKKDAANPVTFAPDPTIGTDTFNDAASFVLSDQYAWAVVKPDTENGAWYVEMPAASGNATRTVTADTTIDADTDDWIIVDATGGDVTLTFPAVSDRVRPYNIVKKDDVHNVSFAADGSDTFSGASMLKTQYSGALVKPDTANGTWYVQVSIPVADVGAIVYSDGDSWVPLPIT